MKYFTYQLSNTFEHQYVTQVNTLFATCVEDNMIHEKMISQCEHFEISFRTVFKICSLVQRAPPHQPYYITYALQVHILIYTKTIRFYLSYIEILQKMISYLIKYFQYNNYGVIIMIRRNVIKILDKVISHHHPLGEISSN